MTNWNPSQYKFQYQLSTIHYVNFSFLLRITAIRHWTWQIPISQIRYWNSKQRYRHYGMLWLAFWSWKRDPSIYQMTSVPLCLHWLKRERVHSLMLQRGSVEITWCKLSLLSPTFPIKCHHNQIVTIRIWQCIVCSAHFQDLSSFPLSC